MRGTRSRAVRDTALAVMGLAAVLVTSWLLVDARAPARREDAARPTAAVPTAQVGETLARETREEAAPARTICRLRFLNPNRFALPGVLLVEARPGDRFCHTEARWRTDATGTAQLELSDHRGQVLVACLEGYATKQVAVTSSLQDQVIILEEAPTQLLSVRDGTGSPVEGLLLLASASPMAEERAQATPEGPWYPGPDPHDAMFRAVTDGHGGARMPWLPDQHYHLKVVDKHWVLHAHDFRTQVQKHAMPGEPLDLVVLQPHVAVLRFEGADVVTSSARVASPQQSDLARLIPEAAELDQGLRKRFADHCVYVGFRRDGAVEPMDLTGEVLTQKGNLVSFKASTVAIVEFRNPAVVRIDEPVAAGGGSILVELHPSLKPYSERLGLRSWWMNSDGFRRRFELHGDRRSAVPAGTHVVGSSEASFHRLLGDQEVVVTEGNEVRVVVAPQKPFRPVLLRARLPEGRKLPGAQVIVVHSPWSSKQEQASHAGRWQEPFELFLPAGSYEMRTLTARYELLWTKFVVDEVEGPPIEIVLEFTPKAKGS